MIFAWWIAAKAFAREVPVGVWIGIAVLAGVGAVYWFAYDAGRAAADARWQAVIERERAEQEKAVREAGEEAWRVIDRLTRELEERNALIEKLNAEGDADPDAGNGGITVDSVRRINRSRKARP